MHGRVAPKDGISEDKAAKDEQKRAASVGRKAEKAAHCEATAHSHITVLHTGEVMEDDFNDPSVWSRTFLERRWTYGGEASET